MKHLSMRTTYLYLLVQDDDNTLKIRPQILSRLFSNGFQANYLNI